jgi:hypothetical protein
MDKDYLFLARAALSRPSGEWNDDDFDVLANSEVVGRIYKANAAPVGSPWMWTLVFWHPEGRSPTHFAGAATFVASLGAAVASSGSARTSAAIHPGPTGGTSTT